MTTLLPSSHIEARIVAAPLRRMRHGEYWPTVEVTELATVVAHESWGTRSATFELVAEAVVDVREGYTREAIESAKAQAHYRINAMRRDLYAAHPDYAEPARY